MKQVSFASFEAVYDHYAPMLYRLAFSILLHKEDAEDALQSVFHKYLSHPPFWNDESHRKAWLIRVTVNQCKDLLRKRKTHASVPLDEIAEIGKEDQHPIELLSDLFSLPEIYKTVLILHYLEDLKVDEIGKILHISKSAVKMRLTRGRELLKTKQREEDTDV